MKPISITKRNIMFSEPMNEYDLNLGLIIGDCRNYIIDTGLGSGSVWPILEYIGSDGKPIVVINTHSCWDHHWGNWVFADSLIIAHAHCRDALAQHWDAQVAEYGEYIAGELSKCLPNLTFSDRLDFRDDGIAIFHTPGHTPCSISVYDTLERVLYVGDNIGDTADKPVPEIFTDIDTYKRTIDMYKQIDFAHLISGHNKPQSKRILDEIGGAL
ncbi:MAG: MBL fold metallo-hydrolase [Defluviitaleaceae bacterium]|nr:MBL fold metallo-hydrolase [Defluviitaleaceae bacterium]